MFIGDSNRVSRPQGAGDYVYRVARHFAYEVSNQVDVKIGRVGSGSRFVGKAKAQQVESINAEVPCQIIKILPPHEAGGAGSYAVDEDKRRTWVFRARGFVKHPTMFPAEEVGLAAECTVIGLACVALNRSVERSQRRHSGATGKHGLPDVSQFAHRNYFLDEREIKLFLVHRRITAVDIHRPEILLDLIQHISFR